jgi:thiopurine S-methyltransferase
MEPDRWLRSWEEGRIGFHRGAVEPALIEHWPTLDLPDAARVLVPLCGKTHDLIWLAERGHEVVGVELSPLACEAFFDEHGLAPTIERSGAYTRWSSGPITVLQGDIFDLDLPPFDAVWDRAATVALDPGRRTRYAELIARHVLPGAPSLLVAFDYPQVEMSGPPFSVGATEVERLYGLGFELTRLAHHDLTLEADNAARWKLSSLHEAVWRLRRRPATE